ncbi:PREDICTED: putative uncharacterized protein FLJ37770 [Wasmannia auropunctata]|uniref:putative uncharacterized protein FLJ37770 n=1 Tax=Wasmannia auropunctata TaxID=64793 RepID=UPI0005EE02C2|nr:PREDICTED: putative uncharacterized protein FLJ37770 [Wasmannia auropunctata]
MEKNEFRAVIKHLHMKGLMPKEIKTELDNIHSTSASALATVYNWVNEFKRGRTSICDASRSGRPIEAATPEIDKIHDIVLTDRRVKVRELVEATSISHGTVISILHEQLDMKKLSARWVPRLLTVDHKRDPGTDGQSQRIPLQITSPFTIFAKFSPLRLFPVFKPKEMVRRKEIHHQKAAHRRNRGLF